MKKLILSLIVLFSASNAYAQKFSTVNMDQVFLKYYRTINAEKQLKKQVRIMEDRAVEMENRHKQVIAEYEKLMAESTSVLLSEDARKQKKDDAENKRGEIGTIEKTMRSFNKDARDMLSKQHNESRTEILVEIRKVIEMVAKNKGYEMVLDNSGKTSNLIPAVVWAKEEFDLTQDVLLILNKGHEKEIEEWEKEKTQKAAEKNAAEEKK
jgi:Skp family chaperone for outer membrane proteins